MNYPLLLNSILARIGRYKLKTLLMSVGIVVSVVATVLMQAAGSGFLGSIKTFTDHAYPIDTVVVYSTDKGKLQIPDLEAVAATVGEISGWDPLVDAGSRDIKNGSGNARIPVTGYSQAAESIGRRGVAAGEFFTAQDISSRGHVALIGATSAKALFADKSPLGEIVFIDNVAFEVKGVLEPLGVDPHGEDQDNTVVLPYTVVMEQILRTDAVEGARFSVSDRKRVEAVAERITAVLRERHSISKDQEDDFGVITPVVMQQNVARAFRIYDIFLPLIAGTTFLISGLMILAIMTITVRQRTQEIGLRKALGAKPRDLQIQIILEVALIAFVAAIVGMLLAKVGANALNPIFAVKFGVKSLSLSAFALFVAVSIAIATAVLGAWIPARRAAKLDPAIALK